MILGTHNIHYARMLLNISVIILLVINVNVFVFYVHAATYCRLLGIFFAYRVINNGRASTSMDLLQTVAAIHRITNEPALIRFRWNASSVRWRPGHESPSLLQTLVALGLVVAAACGAFLVV